MLNRLLDTVEPLLRRAYRGLRASAGPNLTGDRDIEYSWIASTMPEGPGTALDFGAGNSYLGLLAARRGFEVIALDRQPVSYPCSHPRLRFLHADLFDLDLPAASLDLVLACSSVEHVGLTRYGDAAAKDGDLTAMARLRGLLKPGGRMLLTIPVGRDAVFPPLHRVYGRERLPSLLAGFDTERSEYWIKDPSNRWAQVAAATAMERQPVRALYGLGCFVLCRSTEPAEHSC